MSYPFNIDEILEISIQIEKNGAKFYRQASEKITDPETKKFLLGLSEMEVSHEKTFESLRSQLTDAEKAPTVYDPDNETSLYLKALADTKVFYEKEIDSSSIKEVLKEAITAEKDSIVFYLGMKDLVPDKLGKDKIELIIKEEMNHIKILANRLLN